MKSLYEAMLDMDLFGKTFAVPTFKNWRTVAKALDGLPLDDDELEFFSSITGREAAPASPCNELYLVIARRNGKTLFSSAAALHAALQDYSDRLGPGEVATCALIAQDRRGARSAMNFCKGLIEQSPLIKASVESMAAESITFSHRVVLEVHVASFRSTRGYSYAAVVMDELASYRSDFSADPDIELVRAVRPGLSNLHGRLIGLSSPHSKRGHLYAMYAQHYGKPSDVLVINVADSPLLMNPLNDEVAIQRAYAEDPIGARSEWGAHFREDISQFLEDALIDAAIQPRVKSLPRLAGFTYHGFVDPSGGRHDAMTLAISHQESGNTVLDKLVVREPPFVPEEVVEQFAEILNSYGLRSVQGDRFGAAWVDTSFRRHGIIYNPSELDKSAIYIECLPLFAQGFVQLLDVPKLHTELRLLERKPRAGGRGDTVDHPPRATDDCANSVCGSLLMAANSRNTNTDDYGGSITRALSEIDHGHQEPRRRVPLPPGLGGSVGAYEPDYTQTIRDYDPLN
jgi:hypothetical protein